MLRAVIETIETERQAMYHFFRLLLNRETQFLLQSNIVDVFNEYTQTATGESLSQTPFAEMVRLTQEVILTAPWICFSVRYKIAHWSFIRVHSESLIAEEIDASTFLKFKEHMVDPNQTEDKWVLEIDLAPFNREFPKLKEARSIGRGVEFLNRYLSNHLFNQERTEHRQFLHFLRVHQCHGRQLMINDRITDIRTLNQSITRAIDYLERVDENLSWAEISDEMHRMGFEPGWGNTAGRVRETLILLSDLIEAPDHQQVTRFLSRIPMIFNLVIFSPHGYFGQANVLGMPDTGGQVVYILDQVKALEREMKRRLQDQGLDIEPQILVISRLIPDCGHTNCNQRIEPIIGTDNAKIVRVPFRNESGEIIPHWISRFQIWPYLEQFAIEAEKEILAIIGTQPDLLIGNYSDGNMVATLLSRRMNVTQCNIAHALEKSKYLYSDLYWNSMEEEYHFSCQFTADLISMNTADFIITSTYQEICGSPKSVGQYESYQHFTMPGLYRVVNGMDPFDPKFNIVSPGADPDVFFPYTQSEHRLFDLQNEIHRIIYDEPDERMRGHFADPEKPIIFTMARLDRIKNLSGLVRWYSECEALNSRVNLLVIGGHVIYEESKDAEEQSQIQIMHGLYDEFGLDDRVRWVGMHMEKSVSGELYRYIADRRGAFVQPALFEAFGLTVVEAMSTGLPVFATKYGGPSEIIVDGKSGFHIDPNHGDNAALRMADFFKRCEEDDETWHEMSRNAIQRVETHYNWRNYADRLMSLARIYGFWKFVTNLERKETHRYLEMFYGTVLKQQAEQMSLPQ